MRSLLVLTLFAAVCCAAASAAAPQRKLVVLRDVPDVQISSLVEKFDVRGAFGELTFLVATAEELAVLRQTHPLAFDLMPFTDKTNVVVFEKQTLTSDNESALESWSRKMRRAIQGDLNLYILLTLPRHIVVKIHNGDISALRNLAITGDTEVLPLLSSRLHNTKPTAAQRLQSLRKTFRGAQRQADIPALLAQVNQTVLRNFIEYLSGEQAGSPILTRNSYSISSSSGVNLAADYITSEYRGDGFSVTQETFRSDMGPNVIAVLPGAIEPDVYVVLGAHYDSRSTSSSSTTQRAPGANDDGSGTGALLQISKIIADNNLRFRYSVILGSWCGEEQGLVGSRAYAQSCRSRNLDILAMLQADMIAYRASNEVVQMAFPERYDDKDLTALAMDITNTYVPQLRTCYTSACCSDHQSFTEQGYSATQLFERCGSIADVQYHQSGDLLNRANYDLNQLSLITQAMLANLLVIADAQ